MGFHRFVELDFFPGFDQGVDSLAYLLALVVVGNDLGRGVAHIRDFAFIVAKMFLDFRNAGRVAAVGRGGLPAEQYRSQEQ